GSAARASAAWPLESARPGMQTQLHVLDAHTATAKGGGAGQALLHAPQLASEVVVATSQPSPGRPLQSAKPALHAVTTQAPDRQPGVPLAAAHTAPHAEQFAGSVASVTSQPSPPWWLQSAVPALQAPIRHAELTHEAAGLAKPQPA